MSILCIWQNFHLLYPQAYRTLSCMIKLPFGHVDLLVFLIYLLIFSFQFHVSYFYQYFSDGDTYKFDDNTYTYKLFSSINTKEDFFLPTDKDGLIKHYQDDNYTCKVVDN